MKMVLRVEEKNRWVLNQFEKFAANNPKFSRAYALPAGIYTFLKEGFALPIATLIDRSKSLVNRVQHLKQIQGADKIRSQRIAIAMKSYLIVMRLLLIIPVSVLSSIVYSIIKIGHVLHAPYATAKIDSTRAEYNRILKPVIKASNLKSKVTAFAQNIFNKFEKKVKDAKNHEELKSIQSLNTKESIEEFHDEIKAKINKYKDSYADYEKAVKEIKLDKENAEPTELRLRIEKARWNYFDEKLVTSEKNAMPSFKP